MLWNSFEAVASLISGFVAGSVALVGFGMDSLIEVTSGAALLWRLRQDKNTLRREEIERFILRIVASCFLMLSGYILYDSLDSLVRGKAPSRSLPGVVIAAAS
jgi:divalent metal cation (Fe/Co/Zn/Cd) transporter